MVLQTSSYLGSTLITVGFWICPSCKLLECGLIHGEQLELRFGSAHPKSNGTYYITLYYYIILYDVMLHYII